MTQYNPQIEQRLRELHTEWCHYGHSEDRDKFIAAAHNDLPAVLDEIERLRKEHAKLQEELTEARSRAEDYRFR